MKQGENELKFQYSIEQIREIADGDKEFELGMLSTILQEIPITLNRMLEYHSDKEFALTGSQAHKLKATIHLLQINEIADEIQELEDISRDGDEVERIGLLVGKVNEIVSFVLRDIKATYFSDKQD